MKLARAALCIATLCGSLACTEQPLPVTHAKEPAKDCTLEPPARAFVVLPDTQFYACAYPRIFDQQAQWIVDNKRTLGLGIALHTGDIVDHNRDDEWRRAAHALHLLDGELPYLLVTGNHDIDDRRRTFLETYFFDDQLDNGRCAQLVQMKEGKLDNAYEIVTLRDQRWLFLGLEFAPRDATLDWASDVLREHADLPAVLFTHAYLYNDEQRYDRTIEPPQLFHPDTYGVTPHEGSADGEDIWQSVVQPNHNVVLVLSGHVIPDGIARHVAMRDDGSVVHEVLTNFQFCDRCPCEEVEGGNGYLRVFELNEASTSLHVTTYSPHLDASLTDADDEFDLELD